MEAFLQNRSPHLWRERLEVFGLSHLLAISGLHCLLVYLILQALVIPVKGPRLKGMLTLLGLLAFATHGILAAISHSGCVNHVIYLGSQ